MSSGQGFTAWLRSHLKRPDAVGDFARDWCSDDGRPRATSKFAVVEHLEECYAEPEAIRAAQRAWDEFAACRNASALSGVADPAALLAEVRETLLWCLGQIPEPRLIRGQNDEHHRMYHAARALLQRLPARQEGGA